MKKADILPPPVLYSLKNCPYAIRARLALYKAEHTFYLRNIVLKNKPAEMLIASPKGTVPVLITASANKKTECIIDESLDIMLWALKADDPSNLLRGSETEFLTYMLSFIKKFDDEFIPYLERYKSAKRYRKPDLELCRDACMPFLATLEKQLNQHAFLMADNATLADFALFPFIRQFSRVERQWYLQLPFPKLKAWLDKQLQSKLFSKIMSPYPLWLEKKEDVLIAGNGYS